MQLDFFLLVLVVVRVCVLVDCKPKLLHAQQQQHQQQDSFAAETHQDMSTGATWPYLELSGSMRKVILPVRTKASNYVSIFDMRRKRFLCLDSKGKPYNSRKKDRKDCLFQRIWLLENHQDVFYSTSRGRLLKLKRAEIENAPQESPKPSSSLLERFMSSLIKRKRRSEDVNPSDPLRSESNPTHSVKDHQEADHGKPEQDQAGAVSKETITSCDDPLKVLHSNGPVSPVKQNIADRAEQD